MKHSNMKHCLAMIGVFVSLLSLPMVTYLLWRQGAMLVWPLSIAGHVLLNKLIRLVGKTHLELTLLGIAHLVVTIATHLLFWHLWNIRVYGGHPDYETIAAEQAGILIGAAIVLYQWYKNVKAK